MQTVLVTAILIIAIFLVVKGGDIVVDVCLKLSDVTGINDALIGATVVSLATTMPEIVITILGMGQNSVDLVVGNGFGTILVNICLVLGLSLAFISLKRINQQTQKKIAFMLGLTALLAVLAFLKVLNVITGVLFFIAFIYYFVKTFLDIKNDLVEKGKIDEENPIEKVKTKPREKVLMVIWFVVGSLLIFAGAEMIIKCTDYFAETLKISSTVMGLTVVAIGTSLPELATSIASIKKKRLNLAIGNVVGANIINLTLLFSLMFMMSGMRGVILSVSELLILIPVLLMASIILCFPMLIKKRTYKFQGISLLALYAIYCIIIIFLL